VSGHGRTAGDAHTPTTRRVPIACSLEPAERPGRVDAWRDLAVHVVERVDTADGVRVRFDATVSDAELADLASMEQGCCSFLRFTIQASSDGTALEIAGPLEARAVVERLLRSA
jgi:MerR family copper efflux transcriptional regulator